MIIEEKTLYASDTTAKPEIKITGKTGQTGKGIYTCYHVYFRGVEAFKTMFIEQLSAFMKDAEHSVYREMADDAYDAWTEQQDIQKLRNLEGEDYPDYSGAMQIIKTKALKPPARSQKRTGKNHWRKQREIKLK